MYTPEDAKRFYAERAGQQYTPSNGTEGMIFHEEWCCGCERDKEMNGTCYSENREAGDDDWCPILAASFRGEAREWVYGEDGQPKCTAFAPVGEAPSQRDDFTIDMFAAAAATPEGKSE